VLQEVKQTDVSRREKGSAWQSGFHTADEIAFMRGLATGQVSQGVNRVSHGWRGHGANPQAFIAYARLVLTGLRIYDHTVNVWEVRAAARSLLTEISRERAVA